MVQGALGELNKATDDINISEKALSDAKKAFKLQMDRIQVTSFRLAVRQLISRLLAG